MIQNAYVRYLLDESKKWEDLPWPRPSGYRVPKLFIELLHGIFLTSKIHGYGIEGHVSGVRFVPLDGVRIWTEDDRRNFMINEKDGKIFLSLNESTWPTAIVDIPLEFQLALLMAAEPAIWC